MKKKSAKKELVPEKPVNVVAIAVSMLTAQPVFSSRNRGRIFAIEIRIDSPFWNSLHEIKQIIDQIHLMETRPRIILTCRAKEDGGMQALTVDIRLRMMKEVLKMCEGKIWAVDVEGRFLFTSSISDRLDSFVNAVKSRGIKIIVSWHYLDRSLYDESIRIPNHINQALSIGAHVAKVAFGIKSTREYPYTIRKLKKIVPRLRSKRDLGRFNLRLAIMGIGKRSETGRKIKPVTLSTRSRVALANEGYGNLVYAKLCEEDVLPDIPTVRQLFAEFARSKK